MGMLRAFSCETANPYLMFGLLAGATLAWLYTHRIDAERYRGRILFLFGMFGGVMVGSLLYQVINDSCH